MNIKKYSLKIMCAALACTTVLSSTLAAYATDVIINETPMDDSAEINAINTLADDSSGTTPSDSGWTTEENSFEDIKVTYQQSSSYTVTIPKTIALGSEKQATYSVKVSGEIGSNQRVYVAPVDKITDSENLDFHMSDLSGKKADVVATVTQSKTYWSSENVANAYEETNNTVSAPDLTAGTWEGTFQVEIRLETEQAQEHTHNYVDGKCTCGAIDPNHTHNYVDGICTICGQGHTHDFVDGTCTICGETDSYWMGSANVLSNWNYTKDDEAGIVYLHWYIGSEKNVVVYANYNINGKVYKTQIDSPTPKVSANGLFDGGSTATNDTIRQIQSIRFSHAIDTSNMTDMSYMFYFCRNLTTLDISCFDTSNVTNMAYMFSNCEKLTTLDLSNFDTSNVTDMNYMFHQCYELESLDLDSFDTSNVTDMSGMFSDCKVLTSIEGLSNFNTSNVVNMNHMFAGLYRLVNFDLSNFDTRNVTNMGWMFYETLLSSLDLSNFDTNKVTDMFGMFHSCGSLKTIYVTEGKWSTSQATTTDMFKSCGTSEVTYK